MSEALFQRATTHVEGIVDAPVEAVWALLTDFQAILSWWPSEAEGGRPGPRMIEVELIGEPGSVPRTRRIHREASPIVDETLLYENAETHRIYYDMLVHAPEGESGAINAIMGYLCATTLDPVGENRTRMTFDAQFDVRRPVDLEEARGRIRDVHEKAILNGFQRYFARR